MEWLILCLLVPAVVVPVVLLWGFTGCDKVFGLQSVPPSAPVVTATPLAIDAIQVGWVEAGTGPVRFEIQRAKDGGPFELLATVDSPSLARISLMKVVRKVESMVVGSQQIAVSSRSPPANY